MRAGTMGAVIGVLAAFALAPPAEARAKAKPEAAEKAEDPAATAAMRARIAALVLKRVEFGSISLIPVRFAESRLAGPFEDAGRTLYCVGTQMRGRSLFKPERPRALVRLERRGAESVLTATAYDSDICAGHRTEPFPELDAAGRPI